jgi:hypothetical protein
MRAVLRVCECLGTRHRGGPSIPKTMGLDGCVKLMRFSIFVPHNIVRVVAFGEKWVLEYFNTEIQRKSAPVKPRRRRKDNIKLYLKQTVIILTVFNRFGQPSGSVTCCRIVKKLNEHHLLTPCPYSLLVQWRNCTRGSVLRYHCTGF